MTQKQNGNGSGRYTSSRSSAPLFNVGPQTVEQIIATGESAARVLKNEVVNLAYQRTLQNLSQQILESRPEEENKRRGLYWTQQGANEFINMLVGFAQQAEIEIENRSQHEYREQQAMQAGVPLSEI